MWSLHRREGYPLLYCYALSDNYVRRAVAAVSGCLSSWSTSTQ